MKQRVKCILKISDPQGLFGSSLGLIDVVGLNCPLMARYLLCKRENLPLRDIE